MHRRRSPSLRVDKRSGVTLIEILVVVGIIGVLTGVLIAILGSARRRSRQAACAGRLKEIYRAHALYEVDFSQGPYCLNLPRAGYRLEQNPFGGQMWVVDDLTALWMGQLDPYLKTVSLYGCPSADLRNTDWFDAPQLLTPIPVAYGWNVGFVTWAPARYHAQRRKLTKGHESDHMLFVDHPFYKSSYRAKSLLIAGFANVSHTWVNFGGYCPNNRDRRHLGGSNVLFMDGHLEAMDFAAIWTRLNYTGAPEPPNGYVFR